MIIFDVDLTVKKLSVLISQSAVNKFVLFWCLMRLDRWMPGQDKESLLGDYLRNKSYLHGFKK